MLSAILPLLSYPSQGCMGLAPSWGGVKSSRAAAGLALFAGVLG